MREARRSFLKKAAVAGAVTAVGVVAANAKEAYSSGGVVVGHSRKKEIIYKKTKVWSEYYRNAL